MPQLPKDKPEAEPSENDVDHEASWGEDQKKHEYYYDDAHGYETYDPGADDEISDEDCD